MTAQTAIFWRVSSRFVRATMVALFVLGLMKMGAQGGVGGERPVERMMADEIGP